MATRRQKLTEVRKERGDLGTVAAELQISKTYLRLLENGTHKPGRDVMIRISLYFNQPASVLFPDVFNVS